jgi:hypothetical protein
VGLAFMPIIDTATTVRLIWHYFVVLTGRLEVLGKFWPRAGKTLLQSAGSATASLDQHNINVSQNFQSPLASVKYGNKQNSAATN